MMACPSLGSSSVESALKNWSRMEPLHDWEQEEKRTMSDRMLPSEIEI